MGVLRWHVVVAVIFLSFMSSCVLASQGDDAINSEEIEIIATPDQDKISPEETEILATPDQEIISPNETEILATPDQDNSEETEIREYRNGHGEGLLDDDEPSIDDLQPELRVSSTASEVIQLLEEDDTRTTDSKHPGVLNPDGARMDCSKITMQIFQVLLQNPDTVEPEDYSCGLLNLISHFEKSNNRIRGLETSLHTATTTIKTLETSLLAEMSKTQFLMKELNDTVQKESERAIKAENVIARRVLSEKARVDLVQKNVTEMMTSALEKVKEMEEELRNMETQWQGLASKQITPKEPQSFNPSPQILSSLQLPPPFQQTNINDQEIKKIELKLSSLQDFIQDLSNRISQVEDGSEEHVNKGITQIFKTYASLAHEIEKETERATGEETTLKTLITSEIATLTKSIAALQERITEEKNRVQVIENRRTADLFEEINRAKSEENRIGQKLKEEMSKAAAAFKRLEAHVDVQLNSSKLYETDLKALTDEVTKRSLETEEKLIEQITFERTRALSVENSLKVHLETEVGRAMSAENELQKQNAEERERARAAEHELMAALDAEIYRAKGMEYSVSGQVTAETERSKQVENDIREHINANMTRLLTDIIKEFTRAQNAEKELEDKIENEKIRAMTSERASDDNLNREVYRATEKEKEILGLLKVQESSTVVIDKMRNMIEEEAKRATRVESSLEDKISAEVIRARDSEDRLYDIVNGDILEKMRSVEVNVTTTTTDIIKYTKELELEVRKTVMAEVARAVDAESSIRSVVEKMVERATLAEQALEKTVVSNYTDISNKLHDMSKEIEKDSLRLEDISLQISRNLTSDILTLAELFDDKLDDLERSENARLKKVEDDMKKCCSGSSWRWRSPKGNGKTSGASRESATEGVIDKIMKVFGSITEDAGITASKKNSVNNKSSNGATERSLKGSPIVAYTEKEDIHAKHIPLTDTKGNSSVTSTDSPQIGNGTTTATVNLVEDLGERKKILERTRLQRRRLSSPGRNSSRISLGNNASSVSVHSVNSKVTSTYG